MQQLTIRLPEEIHEQLRTIAIIERRTMAEIVREIIQEKIDANEEVMQVAEAIAQARKKRGVDTGGDERDTPLRPTRRDDSGRARESRFGRGRWDER